MPIDVQDLIDEALERKRQIVEDQQVIESAMGRIKHNRHIVKTLNPVIASLDGEVIDLPDGRRNGKPKKAAERKSPPRITTKKEASRKGQSMPPKWAVYPEECLLPGKFHHTGQKVAHIGRGLCNAHAQMYHHGRFANPDKAEEREEYIKRAQAFAEKNGFELPDGWDARL